MTPEVPSAAPEPTPVPVDDPPPICPILTLAGETFERDLPDLLRTHRDQWTAYHGARRLGIVKTYQEAHQLYIALGIHPYEVVIWCIEPLPDADFIGLGSYLGP